MRWTRPAERACRSAAAAESAHQRNQQITCRAACNWRATRCGSRRIPRPCRARGHRAVQRERFHPRWRAGASPGGDVRLEGGMRALPAGAPPSEAFCSCAHRARLRRKDCARLRSSACWPNWPARPRAVPLQFSVCAAPGVPSCRSAVPCWPGPGVAGAPGKTCGQRHAGAFREPAHTGIAGARRSGRQDGAAAGSPGTGGGRCRFGQLCAGPG